MMVASIYQNESLWVNIISKSYKKAASRKMITHQNQYLKSIFRCSTMPRWIILDALDIKRKHENTRYMLEGTPGKTSETKN